MKLKDLLTHLLKEDAPDEEKRGNAAQDPPSSRYLEKGRTEGGVPAQGSGAPDDADADMDQDDPDIDLNPPGSSPPGLRRVLARVWSFIFPAPSSEHEIQAYMPHYRVLPILSGIIIPFCILLEVPGLTEKWYIRMQGSDITASKDNPVILDVGIALSILCAVLANACLVIRFLERRIKAMTILCTVFLSIHDMINVSALVGFGATKGDYTFSQAFWMTLCSTVVSMFTNVTLIVDLIQTPDFTRSGSGLTRKQRSLVIIIIGLFCYIALGALTNSLLLEISFINGLYFTVVTIETIGFGDIVPTSTGSRIFICFYATIGIIHLAVVVGYVREAVLEGLDFGYRKRLQAIQEKRRLARRRRRVEKRWRYAVLWRLRERHVPVWVPKTTNDRRSVWSTLASSFNYAKWGIRSTASRGNPSRRGHPGTQLNLWALPPCQLEAAALEAGAPLDTFLPPNFHDTYDESCHHATGVEHHALPSWFAVHSVYSSDERCKEPLMYRRLGAMAAILTRLGFVVYESGGNPLPATVGGAEDVTDSSGTLRSTSTGSGGSYRQDVEYAEQKAYFTRSCLSWVWFLAFWMGGAAIFKATEGWTFGLAMYFCFISFTTIGYGDLVPTTPAGRSIFVVWALIGVATMTIFISVVSEAYSSRYKGILGRNSFNQIVRQYHERKKAELSEKVEQIGSSIQAKPPTQDTFVQDESLRVHAFGADDGTTSSEPHQQVKHNQRSLEKLPQKVLMETRSIEQYVQLINEFDGRSVEAEEFVGGLLRGLMDDVMGGKQMTEETKKDILKDGESRQTLMLLGIERSLKELVDISEKAIETIRERDRIIAALKREREQDEPEIGA